MFNWHQHTQMMSQAHLDVPQATKNIFTERMIIHWFPHLWSKEFRRNIWSDYLADFLPSAILMLVPMIYGRKHKNSVSLYVVIFQLHSKALWVLQTHPICQNIRIAITLDTRFVDNFTKLMIWLIKYLYAGEK